MRKADLEIRIDYDDYDSKIEILNKVNSVLYEQGFGIQFKCDENPSNELVRYNLIRSVELIQC